MKIKNKLIAVMLSGISILGCSPQEQHNHFGIKWTEERFMERQLLFITDNFYPKRGYTARLDLFTGQSRVTSMSARDFYSGNREILEKHLEENYNLDPNNKELFFSGLHKSGKYSRVRFY